MRGWGDKANMGGYADCDTGNKKEWRESAKGKGEGYWGFKLGFGWFEGCCKGLGAWSWRDDTRVWRYNSECCHELG